MAKRKRTWKCRKCGKSNPRVNGLCKTKSCAGKRPKPRRPKHQDILKIPYEEWAERYGEVCGICGKKASPTRRLDRDHCHASGSSRGLLCFRCNRALPAWKTVEWLRAAADYLERAASTPSLEVAL